MGPEGETKRARTRILIAIATLLTANVLYAQNGAKPAYLNPALPPEQCAEDLVRHMTVEEQVAIKGGYICISQYIFEDDAGTLPGCKLYKRREGDGDQFLLLKG